VCGLAATGVLVAASMSHVYVLALVLASAMIVLVLARTALTLRENAQLLEDSRREALTDSLTGLANRRKLLIDLEVELERASDGEPPRTNRYCARLQNGSRNSALTSRTSRLSL